MRYVSLGGWCSRCIATIDLGSSVSRRMTIVSTARSLTLSTSKIPAGLQTTERNELERSSLLESGMTENKGEA